MKKSLYQIGEQYRILLDMLEDEEIDADILKDTMESLEGELTDKADNYGAIIRNLEADAVAIKQEEERLNKRRKTLENNISNMKKVLQEVMTRTENRKIKTALFTFNIQKNPPKLEIVYPELVPTEFLIPQDPKIDSNRVKDLLKTGTEVSWARLVQGESLRIK